MKDTAIKKSKKKMMMMTLKDQKLFLFLMKSNKKRTLNFKIKEIKNRLNKHIITLVKKILLIRKRLILLKTINKIINLI